MTGFRLSEPGLLYTLCAYTLLSGAGVYSQLTASKEGQAAAEEAARLLHLATSGYDRVDRTYAKRLALTGVDAVLQSPLGVFFAASLAASCYAACALLTKALFLGQLTACEASQLADRLLKFALLKAALLAAVQSPGFGRLWQWLAWCAVTCWFSMFTKLASLRGDALLSSPRAAPLQHLRTLLLLGGILAQHLSWVAAFLRSAPRMEGALLSMELLWLHDAAFVSLDAGLSLAKYAVGAASHWRAARAEARGEAVEAWEGGRCADWSYWLDLASDLGLASLALLHHAHVWALKCHQHGLQPQLADALLLLESRMLAGYLWGRLRRHAASRRMLRALRTACLDAGVEQLARGPCCVCLEAMRAGKLLPCGHVLHASCLRAWLQQNAAGTCPLCRASLEVGLARCQREQQAALQPRPTSATGHSLGPWAEPGRGGAAAEAPAGGNGLLRSSLDTRRPVTRSQTRRATAAASEAGATAAPAVRLTSWERCHASRDIC